MSNNNEFLIVVDNGHDAKASTKQVAQESKQVEQTLAPILSGAEAPASTNYDGYLVVPGTEMRLFNPKNSAIVKPDNVSEDGAYWVLGEGMWWVDRNRIAYAENGVLCTTGKTFKREVVEEEDVEGSNEMNAAIKDQFRKRLTENDEFRAKLFEDDTEAVLAKLGLNTAPTTDDKTAKSADSKAADDKTKQVIRPPGICRSSQAIHVPASKVARKKVFKTVDNVALAMVKNRVMLTLQEVKNQQTFASLTSRDREMVTVMAKLTGQVRHVATALGAVGTSFATFWDFMCARYATAVRSIANQFATHDQVIGKSYPEMTELVNRAMENDIKTFGVEVKCTVTFMEHRTGVVYDEKTKSWTLVDPKSEVGAAVPRDIALKWLHAFDLKTKEQNMRNEIDQKSLEALKAIQLKESEDRLKIERERAELRTAELQRTLETEKQADGKSKAEAEHNKRIKLAKDAQAILLLAEDEKTLKEQQRMELVKVQYQQEENRRAREREWVREKEELAKKEANSIEQEEKEKKERVAVEQKAKENQRMQLLKAQLQEEEDKRARDRAWAKEKEERAKKEADAVEKDEQEKKERIAKEKAAEKKDSERKLLEQMRKEIDDLKTGDEKDDRVEVAAKLRQMKKAAADRDLEQRKLDAELELSILEAVAVSEQEKEARRHDIVSNKTNKKSEITLATQECTQAIEAKLEESKNKHQADLIALKQKLKEQEAEDANKLLASKAKKLGIVQEQLKGAPETVQASILRMFAMLEFGQAPVADIIKLEMENFKHMSAAAQAQKLAIVYDDCQQGKSKDDAKSH